MTPAAFQTILARVTAKMLDELPLNPFMTARRDFADWGAAAFPDPTTWDINCGLCDQWAGKVAAMVPGAEWDFIEVNDNDHAVLIYQGRYYDAECPQGVERVEDLPIHRNEGVSRLDVLTSRQK